MIVKLSQISDHSPYEWRKIVVGVQKVEDNDTRLDEAGDDELYVDDDGYLLMPASYWNDWIEQFAPMLDPLSGDRLRFMEKH